MGFGRKDCLSAIIVWAQALRPYGGNIGLSWDLEVFGDEAVE
ncbi:MULTISPECIES: hypothetical protein [unclassified Microcystis]|jgi:hypothetical protein|nr:MULTISPECIES: hypothetical protein [unclassified Microcystis]